MKATITKSHSRRNKTDRSVVYIESPLDTLADKFATEHGVYGLPYKCDTWRKLCREVTKQTVSTLKELFVEALSIKFSSKAGCTCGCSPGYIVKHGAGQRGNDVWVNLEASDDEISAFSSLINNRFEPELRKEIMLTSIKFGK